MGDFFGLPESSEVSFIGQVANAAIVAVYGVLSDVTGQIDGALADIWNGIESVFGWLEGIWKAFENWIINAIRWLYHQLLPDLVRWINEIRAKITAWLQPLINWIKFEKAWLDLVYNQLLKPILNFLQELRSMLVIFRVMGLKWAVALDQYIADLEGKITTAFLEARQDINTLANWINYIVDPTGLFNVPLFLLTQLQTLPQLWAALEALPSNAIGAADAQAQATAAASGQKSNITSEINSRADGATQSDLTRYSQIVALYQGDGYTV